MGVPSFYLSKVRLEYVTDCVADVLNSVACGGSDVTDGFTDGVGGVCDDVAICIALAVVANIIGGFNNVVVVFIVVVVDVDIVIVGVYVVVVLVYGNSCSNIGVV